MRYVGGKSRTAAAISREILSRVDADRRSVYIEPFMGGGAVFERLAPSFRLAFGGDTSPDLVMMWDAVVHDDWEPPEVVTETDYQVLRFSPASAMRGFVGFGGSFGGKFFGGYARGGVNSYGEPRNHQGESARAVARIGERLRKADTVTYFENIDYRVWVPAQGDVVYCDPPYAGTQGYAVGAFDSAEFWRWAISWAVGGAHVFVSEFSAPAHPYVECVAEFPSRSSLQLPEQGRTETVERLFHVKRP